VLLGITTLLSPLSPPESTDLAARDMCALELNRAVRNAPAQLACDRSRAAQIGANALTIGSSDPEMSKLNFLCAAGRGML